MAGWERRRILIWGKTRPEMSTKYRETVCTGGVFADNRRMVRLFPIPLRFLDEEDKFRRYQWIEASVMKAPNDPRPESYKISYGDIDTQELIPPDKSGWAGRAEWIMAPGNAFQSVEDIQAARKADGTSLGIVKPGEVVRVVAERTPEEERKGFWDRYLANSQREMELDLELRVTSPLPPQDFRFKVSFHCDDPRCTSTHEFTIRDWEIDALYKNMLQRHGHDLKVASRKVVEAIETKVNDCDLQFYLGTIANHPTRFTIVGLWYPKKTAQLPLF